jgi:glutamate racemase
VHKTIGVFDSGIGGLSLANAIQKALPGANVLFKNDSVNVPYGTKTQEELRRLCLPLITDLAEKSDVLVIACNTLTTNILAEIKAAVDIPVIGVEPLIERAKFYTKTNTICVCATPRTLTSARYAQLKNDFAQGLNVLEPDCSEWSGMIEKYDVDHKKVRKTIKAACKNGADVIVLGCTHYHWISDEISRTAEKYGAIVIYPEESVIVRIEKSLIELAYTHPTR